MAEEKIIQMNDEVRATFIVRPDLNEKMKAIAYWDRKLIKDVVNEAFEAFINKYEKSHGQLVSPPSKAA